MSPIDSKANVVVVGTVENGCARGWTFDCKGTIPAVNVECNGESVIAIAGYTIAELEEIVRRNSTS